MAGGAGGSYRAQGRALAAAALVFQRMPAAGMERAARRWRARTGYVAAQDDAVAAASGIRLRYRGEQRHGVGVTRLTQHRVGGTFLHDSTQVHDRDPLS